MSENKNSNGNPPIEITNGAIWSRETREEKRPYMYVKFSLDGKDYCMYAFQNTFKQPGENTPDFRTKRLPLDQPQPANAAAAPAPRRQTATSNKTVAAPTQASRPAVPASSRAAVPTRTVARTPSIRPPEPELEAEVEADMTTLL
jgi:hypothetical protein